MKSCIALYDVLFSLENLGSGVLLVETKQASACSERRLIFADKFLERASTKLSRAGDIAH